MSDYVLYPDMPLLSARMNVILARYKAEHPPIDWSRNKAALHYFDSNLFYVK